MRFFARLEKLFDVIGAEHMILAFIYLTRVPE